MPRGIPNDPAKAAAKKDAFSKIGKSAQAPAPGAPAAAATAAGALPDIDQLMERMADRFAAKVKAEFESRIAALEGRAPAMIRKTQESGDAPEVTLNSIDMLVTGQAEDINTDVDGEIEVVDISAWKRDQFAALKFMEEMVTVIVQDQDSQFEDPVVPISVNGITQHFIRGEEIRCKRKYLNGLIVSQPIRIDTEEFTDKTGAKAFKINRKISFKYPITLVEDSAQGHAWFKKAKSLAAL